MFSYHNESYMSSIQSLDITAFVKCSPQTLHIHTVKNNLGFVVMFMVMFMFINDSGSFR